MIFRIRKQRNLWKFREVYLVNLTHVVDTLYEGKLVSHSNLDDIIYNN